MLNEGLWRSITIFYYCTLEGNLYTNINIFLKSLFLKYNFFFFFGFHDSSAFLKYVCLFFMKQRHLCFHWNCKILKKFNHKCYKVILQVEYCYIICLWAYIYSIHENIKNVCWNRFLEYWNIYQGIFIIVR